MGQLAELILRLRWASVTSLLYLAFVGNSQIMADNPYGVSTGIHETIMEFDIQRQGRRWTRAEVEQKYHKLCPEKIELIEGKMFWTDEERLNMLALLLDNGGMDAAVRLGDPALWKRACRRGPPPCSRSGRSHSRTETRRCRPGRTRRILRPRRPRNPGPTAPSR